MCVHIFDRKPFGYMAKNLQKQLKQKGIEAKILNWEDVSFIPFPFQLKIQEKEIQLPSVAVIFSKVYTRNTYSDLSLIKNFLEMLEMQGVYCINPINSTMNSFNKLYAAAILGKNNLSIPKTSSLKSVLDLSSHLNLWKDVIVKPPFGNGSIDVHRFIEKQLWSDATTSVNPFEEILLWNLLKRYGVMCIQEFIEKRGYEYRIQVIDGKVVSAFDKVGSLNNWKSVDYLIQSSTKPHIPTAEEFELALKGVNSFNLDWATIDMVNGENGPVILEVNPALSWWEGYENVAYIFDKPMEELVVNSVINKLNSHVGVI